MPYSASYNDLFALEFQNYPADQQNAVVGFVTTFVACGLRDFSRYPGKIAPSWGGLDPSHPDYAYTTTNHLWHYHLGVPVYTPSISGRYLTSDIVLHFEWPHRGSSIHLVDTCYHYLKNSFYIPAPKYLVKSP
ncbi:hypothetical protein IMF22_01720 [Pseudomonas poae]|uniref:Uncharacterized protein n=1 Tax=Pseudomonas poae TaxID=200451 RepID=A0A7M1KKG5_9PSED|nr:hypothetical protein [Pseudomonas poae]QOQ75820.1 hypothetical protein IMF22_01720 [Pseudomonas poae]